MKPRATDTEIRAAFAQIVNMTPREIEEWHATDESKSVGQDCGDGAPVGVRAGQSTIQILRIKRAPNADDIKHMRRVISFINRMRTQSPPHNPETSRWRYVLMNWGHDPLKFSDADSSWR